MNERGAADTCAHCIVGSAEIAEALLPHMRAAARPVLTCWMGGDSVAQARKLRLDAGLPVFDTPEAAVQAFMHLVQYQIRHFHP